MVLWRNVFGRYISVFGRFCGFADDFHSGFVVIVLEL